MYEGTGLTELTDIICCMYPDVAKTVGLTTIEDDDRPIILCEYRYVALLVLMCCLMAGSIAFLSSNVHPLIILFASTFWILSHSMGNSNGNISWYWRYFWDDEYPRLQGGFIWDMIDQGLRQPDTKNGKGFYFA